MIVIYVPVGSEGEARSLARTLIEEKLVACANLIPIRSLYRWEGKIQEEPEVGMLLKTREELRQACTKRVEELHSYQVPCIAVVGEVAVNRAYESWLREETSGSPEGGDRPA